MGYEVDSIYIFVFIGMKGRTDLRTNLIQLLQTTEEIASAGNFIIVVLVLNWTTPPQAFFCGFSHSLPGGRS